MNNKLRLLTSLATFEQLHERADRARTNVKIPKRLLIDNAKLHDAAGRAGVRIEDTNTVTAESA